MAEQLFCCFTFNDVPLVHHRYPVAETADKGEIVCNKQHGHGEFCFEVLDKPNIIGIRNIFKEFLLDRKAYIKIGKDIYTKEIFNYFDSSEDLAHKRDTLYSTESENEFYTILQEVISYMLAISEDRISQ